MLATLDQRGPSEARLHRQKWQRQTSQNYKLSVTCRTARWDCWLLFDFLQTVSRLNLFFLGRFFFSPFYFHPPRCLKMSFRPFELFFLRCNMCNMTQKEIKKKTVTKNPQKNTTPPMSSLISLLHSSFPTRHNKPQAVFFFCKHLEFMRRERKKWTSELLRSLFYKRACSSVEGFYVKTAALHVISTTWSRSGTRLSLDIIGIQVGTITAP